MPKPIAAVIIPTIGTRKTKKPLSPEEQVRAWGKLVRTVIASARQSVARAGFEPRIIPADNSPNDLSPLHRQQLAKTGVEILFAANLDPYESFRVGGRKAIREGRSQVVLTCLDDYESESAHLDKMIQPLKNGKTDFVFGRCRPSFVSPNAGAERNNGFLFDNACKSEPGNETAGILPAGH